MLQLIRHITNDPKDSTKCYLLFANQVSILSHLSFINGITFLLASEFLKLMWHWENTALHTYTSYSSSFSLICNFSQPYVTNDMIWGGISKMISIGGSRKCLLYKFLLCCLGVKWFMEKANQKIRCKYINTAWCCCGSNALLLVLKMALHSSTYTP